MTWLAKYQVAFYENKYNITPVTQFDIFLELNHFLVLRVLEDIQKVLCHGIMKHVCVSTLVTSNKYNSIHLIHKWRNARKSLGRVHESEAKGASDSNENKAEYGNASSISCIS